MADPTGWTRNPNGTYAPPIPAVAGSHGHLEVPKQVQSSDIKDGSLIVYDASGTAVVRLGKLTDGSYGLQLLSGATVFSQLSGSTLDVRDAEGDLRVRIGKDGSDYDVKVYSTTGTNPVMLSTLAFGLQAATNDATGTRALASYGDLTGGGAVGPAVTATIGPSGRAVVWFGCEMIIDGNNTVSEQGQVSFAVSGATTIAASDARSCSAILQNSTETGIGQWQGTLSRVVVESALTAGSNTFTLKYKTNSGTVSYLSRWIVVQPF